MVSAYNMNGFGTRAGLLPFSSPTGYGDWPYQNQVDSTILPTLQARQDANANARMGLSAPAAWGSSAWGSAATPNTRLNPGWGTSSGNGGLPLLTTSKSPAGNAALDAVLGRVSSLSNDPTQPAFTTTKDPATQARIDAQGATLDSGNAGANQSLADFTSNFLAADPQAKGNQEQESAAIGKWYAPASDPTSVQASLNTLVNQRRQAVQGAVSRAIDRAVRQGNINRMGAGGDSSYLNAQFADTAAGINANEAATEAELNRQNFVNVSNAQTALAGKRNGLLNDYLTRGLIPIQAGQQLQASETGNLGALTNVQNANRIVQTPEQLQAARLGLLGQYGQDLNGLNIFGVGGNFSSPFAGQAPRSMSPNGFQAPGDNNGGVQYIQMPGGGVSLAPANQRLSPAMRQAYINTTGRAPETDPSFNQNLVDWLQANPKDWAWGADPNGGRVHSQPDVPPEYQDYLDRYGLDATGQPLEFGGLTPPTNTGFDAPSYDAGGWG